MPPLGFLPFYITIHTQHITSDTSGHMCEGFPPPNYSLQHELGVSPINSLLTLHLLQRPVPSLGYHLCSWLMGSKSEVPRAPSSGLTNLLEQLRELRATLTYTTSLLNGTDEQTHNAWSWEGPEYRHFCPHGDGVTSPSRCVVVFTNLEASQTPEWDFYRGFLL